MDNFLAQDMIDKILLCTVHIYSAHAQCPHLEHYVFARLTCCIYGLRKEGGVELYVQDKAVGTEGAGGGRSPLQILADQLTLFQPGDGSFYAHHITTRPLGFSDLPSALQGID